MLLMMDVIVAMLEINNLFISLIYFWDHHQMQNLILPFVSFSI